MTTTPLDSSLLASATYDPRRRLLRLEFRSRSIYLYRDVPANVADALLAASSKGAYFHRSIRGQFPFRRLTDAPAQ